MRAKHPPGFLNVDLEIVSRSKLDLLEVNLSKLAHALYAGQLRRGIYMLALECNRYPRDADAGILKLCTAIDQLGRAERRLWNRALSRKFDVGYSLESENRLVQVSLLPETLERVLSVRATIAFSCYSGASPNNPPAPGASRPQ